MSLQGPQKRDALVKKRKIQFCRAYFQSQCYVQLGLRTIDLNLKLRLPNQLQILKAEWRVEIQAQGWQPCAILVILCFCTKQ